MNKARRHELKMLKYKKRIMRIGLQGVPASNLTAYRSHGAPCSCSFCSHSKYKRPKERQRVFEIAIKPHNEDSAEAIEYLGAHYAALFYGFHIINKVA